MGAEDALEGAPQESEGLLGTAIAFVLAEELTVDGQDGRPRQRVAPDEVQATLATQPIKVVLDRLETKMSFDASHDWVMRSQPALKGVTPVDALARGRVREVLSAVDEALAT